MVRARVSALAVCADGAAPAGPPPASLGGEVGRRLAPGVGSVASHVAREYASGSLCGFVVRAKQFCCPMVRGTISGWCARAEWSHRARRHRPPAGAAWPLQPPRRGSPPPAAVLAFLVASGRGSTTSRRCTFYASRPTPFAFAYAKELTPRVAGRCGRRCQAPRTCLPQPSDAQTQHATFTMPASL